MEKLCANIIKVVDAAAAAADDDDGYDDYEKCLSCNVAILVGNLKKISVNVCGAAISLLSYLHVVYYGQLGKPYPEIIDKILAVNGNNPLSYLLDACDFLLKKEEEEEEDLGENININLNINLNNNKRIIIRDWWRLRYLLTLKRLNNNRNVCDANLSENERILKIINRGSKNSSKTLSFSTLLEKATCYFQLKQPQEAMQILSLAMKERGLSYEFVSSSSSSSATPTSLSLKVTKLDDRNLKSLEDHDIVLLLNICEGKRRTTAIDSMAELELKAFTSFILTNTFNNFLIRNAATMIEVSLRMDVRKSKSTSIERAMQSLISLLSSSPLPFVTNRNELNFFTIAPIVSIQEMKKQLSRCYYSLGMLNDAVNIYVELELYQDAIECYLLMGDADNCRILVERQLKIKQTPFLLCTMGRIANSNDAIDYFSRAWELSNHRYSLAKHYAGEYWYKRDNFQLAATELEIFLSSSTSSSPSSKMKDIISSSYYLIGCCYLKLYEANGNSTNNELLKFASNAFEKYVELNQEDGEGWNNLATCLMKLGDKINAWQALQQAMKYNSNNIKILENFIILSGAVKEFRSAVHSLNLLITTLSSTASKTTTAVRDILFLLVQSCINNETDASGQPCRSYLIKDINLLCDILKSDDIDDDETIASLRRTLSNISEATMMK